MTSIQILERYAYTGIYFVGMELNVIDLAPVVIAIACIQGNVLYFLVVN